MNSINVFRFCILNKVTWTDSLEYSMITGRLQKIAAGYGPLESEHSLWWQQKLTAAKEERKVSLYFSLVFEYLSNTVVFQKMIKK